MSKILYGSGLKWHRAHFAFAKAQSHLAALDAKEEVERNFFLSIFRSLPLQRCSFPHLSSLVFLPAVKNPKFLGQQIFISTYAPGTVLDGP